MDFIAIDAANFARGLTRCSAMLVLYNANERRSRATNHKWKLVKINYPCFWGGGGVRTRIQNGILFWGEEKGKTDGAARRLIGILALNPRIYPFSADYIRLYICGALAAFTIAVVIGHRTTQNAI